MSELRPIRVMIVDDHDMVRMGLGVMLETNDDLELAGEATSGEEAIRLCGECCPDVVLMDLIMPGMDGVETIHALREICPGIKVIALTSFKEKNLVEGALNAGAISYLLKNVSIDTLTEAIRSAFSGKTTIAPEVTQVLIKAVTEPPQLGHDLTDRELEVLALMVKGLTNRQIGENLTISHSTVKHHVSNILSKLEASSRAEATALAMQHELVS